MTRSQEAQAIAGNLLKAEVPLLTPFQAALREKGFNPSPEVYQEVRTSFLRDLKKASRGEPSPISFILHPLPDQPILKNGIGQAFVYGGTNYATSVVRVENGKPIEELFRRKRKPAPTENVLDMMEADYDPRAQAIAGNIGQELTPTTGPFGELDGTPTKRSQGIKGQAIDLVPMGDTMRARLSREDLPATFANDTVAIADRDGGAIIGTGFNKAIIIEREGKKYAVNLESGGQPLPASEKALIAKIDAQLTPQERNKHEIEKEAAGGYLAINFNLAAQESGLSARIKSGEDLTDLATSDKEHAGELARVLIARSAMYEAAQLAAIHEFMGQRPITLIGDGSLIRDAWKFQELVQAGLEYFGVPEGNVAILTPDDVAMKGAVGLLTGSIAA